MFKFSLHKDINYALLEDTSTGIRVGNLMAGPPRRPSVIAMALARYSRSADPMHNILNDLVNSEDAAERIANIAFNYGHSSVRGMAHTAITIEDVSMLDHLRFFYTHKLINGQARSTRYQNFSKPKYMAIPNGYGSDNIRSLYKSIIGKQINDYRETIDYVRMILGVVFDIDENDPNELRVLNSRTLDCLRYYLPLGLKDSFGAIINTRELVSNYLCKYIDSNDPVTKRLIEIIIHLFRNEGNYEGYIPEVGTLIKHINPRPKIDNDLVDYYTLNIRKGDYTSWSITQPENDLRITEYSAEEDLILRIASMSDPLSMSTDVVNDKELENIGDIIFNNFDHHVEAGPECASGSITVQGMADIGSIKDLIRHQSLSRFVPILHDATNMIAELNRPNKECFYIPPYYNLRIAKDRLLDDYVSRLSSTYEEIKTWYCLALAEMPIDLVNHYVKRLLPHAHATQYFLSGSIKDFSYLTQLRTRPGGHIQYRLITESIADQLANISPFYNALIDKIPEVSVDSKEQFLDRS